MGRAKVIHWLSNLLYGATPAECASSFGLEESLQRLSSVTGRSVFSGLSKQMAVGNVAESRVSLQRAIPMMGNSFKPLFIGRFVNENGRVVLKGAFTMSRSTKVHMSSWFGFIE